MIIIPLIVIIILILINGLFVAAEFAIIGVRKSRIEQLEDEGRRGAERVGEILGDRDEVDRYVATAQLGITLASLGLGMYGEPSIAHFIEGPLEHWFGIEGAAVHTISFIIALSLITYLHVVVGEMVPKSMALQNAEGTVLGLIPIMSIMERMFAPPVWVLNSIGALTLRVLGVSPPDEGSRLYSEDELEMIVTESFEGGMLEEREQELAANIFDFGERLAVQVMTPRTRMEAVPVGITEDEFLMHVNQGGHSRLPVYEGNVDRILGVVHVKDYIRQQLAGAPFSLKGMLREVPFVPERVHVEELLGLFKTQRSHLAIVIDEFGGTSGVVTLEDLIEEIFGEVQDEFDVDEVPPIIEVAAGELSVEGTVLCDEIEEYVSLGDRDSDIQTIGGFVLDRLGRIPEVGDEVTIQNVRVRVEQVDERAVSRVLIYFEPDDDKTD